MSANEAGSSGGAIVVMGPSGCGKSTLGAALATKLGWRFIEGDDLHPVSNIEKMARGDALTDEDRMPWLDRVGRVIRDHRRAGVVVSCSALRLRYRDRIRAVGGEVLFVMPVADEEVLAERLARRSGHFMPASLLADQLQVLEPPGRLEQALILASGQTVAEMVETAGAFLAGLRTSPLT
jgi:gluconokinase